MEEEKKIIYPILDDIFEGCELNHVGSLYFFINNNKVIYVKRRVIEYSRYIVTLIAREVPYDIDYNTIFDCIVKWMKERTGVKGDVRHRMLDFIENEEIISNIITFLKNKSLLEQVVDVILKKSDVFSHRGELLFRHRNKDIMSFSPSSKTVYVSTALNIEDHIGVEVLKSRKIIVELYEDFIVDIMKKRIPEATLGLPSEEVVYRDSIEKYGITFLGKGVDFIK